MLVVAQLTKIVFVFYGTRNAIRYHFHKKSSRGLGVRKTSAVDIREVKSRKAGWDRYGSKT